MASPCNTLNTQTIKISQLPAYSYLTSSDYILVVQSSSGGALYSRRSTLGDLLTYVREADEGGFTGSFSGNIVGDLTGTSSWAETAVTTVSASYSLSSSKAYSSTYAAIATSALISNTAQSANTSSLLLTGKTNKPITCSFAEEATAGSDSGQYMPIMVDGVKYKVKLYDWS